MPPQQPQLDPQVVNLAKAIRQIESGGNFQAKGKSGEYGAYQFMPDTWASSSQKYLGQNIPIQQATPQQQNEVAYKQIKEWKDQGYNVGQIASLWNSGTPDWQGKIGTNKMGVAYNVPKYVDSVANAYQIIKKGGNVGLDQNNPSSVGNTYQPEQKSLLRKVGDFFTGGTQQFGKTIGESIAAPQNAQMYADAMKNYSDTTNSLNLAIKDRISKGEDPSRLQMALKQHLQNVPQLKDFTGDVINKSAEQVIGEGTMAGLEALSGGLLETGVKGVLAKEVGTIGKIGQGSKIGSIFGAIGGGANAMQENKDLGSIVVSTALGAGGGAVLGGGLSAAGGLAGKVAGAVDRSGLINKIVPQTESRIAKTEKFVQEARAKIADAYKKALPLTPTQQLKEQNLLNKTGDNVYTTLAKYNINVGNEGAISNLQTISDKYSNATRYAQQNEHALFNLDEIINRAVSSVNENLPSQTARDTAINKIENEIEALLKVNKNSVISGPNGERLVDSKLVERLRRTGNSWTPFNASDPEKVGRSAGYALSNAVRDQVEKEGTFPSYREANREWGKIIHAQEVLQKIEDSGKSFKVIGGLSGAIARRVLSGVLGLHSGGISGLILSEVGSEYAAKILSNPELRTYFDRKILERFPDGKAPEKAILKLVQEVQTHIDNLKSLPALPPPSYIPLGNNYTPGPNYNLPNLP